MTGKWRAGWRSTREGVVAWGLALSLGTSPLALQAQLAITEVMASAMTSGLQNGPDFWELTNFGTNDINLHGYGFSDSARNIVRYPFTNLTIHAGESVVFFELDEGGSDVHATNAAQFCQWWFGTTNPPNGLVIRSWVGFGLSSRGDEVWLYDPASQVVDMVAFEESTPGRTFIYDANTGIFGLRSTLGQGCTLKAATTDDLGSPGCTTGPVPLTIFQQPASQDVDAGVNATFTVLVGGLPRPKYQWRKGGEDLAGQTQPSLTVANVSPADAGSYTVRVDNGFQSVTSNPALLTVNTNPLAPHLLEPPADWTVFPQQCAEFQVVARGYPLLQYQWRSNGMVLAGETNRGLTVYASALGLPPTVYSVEIWNALGATNASAKLKVTKRPRLKITEIMSYPTNDVVNGHDDWFELTNGDTEPVNLQRYRFRDAMTLATAFVITNSLIIRPGESIIFVKELSLAAFQQWWGAQNLPGSLQVFRFTGFGLNNRSEVICFWNEAARDLDTVATASYAASILPPFGEGVSIECDTSCDDNWGCVSDCLTDSVVGVRGALRAADGGDIGSPGYSTFPQFREIHRTESGATLQWHAVVGKTYRLQCKASFNEGNWSALCDVVATNCPMVFTDRSATNSTAQDAGRFYRLEELP